MSLTKPLLSAVPAWDATLGYTFNFSVVGGDQVTGSTLTIRNNTTNVVVYTHTEASYKYTNTVPPNVVGMVNGTYYNAYLTTTNAIGEMSIQSNIIQFYCYSSPILSFTNITAGDIVPNSFLAASLQYTQQENELLNSYSINLFNAAQVQIATSGNKYITSSENPPTTVTYNFGGLEDNTVYYISGNGVTVNGTIVTTGLIQFTVKYVQPSAFAILELTNNCNGGYITIKSNATIISGTSNPSPPVYIQDKEVNLTSGGYWVRWGEGYTINGDFTAKLWFREANENTTFLTFLNKAGDKITLRYMQDYEDTTKVYVDLTADDGYYIYSSSITKPNASALACVQIRRVNNIYELVFEAVS